MRSSQAPINKTLDQVLAEARALRYTVQHGGMSYDQAKAKADALLQIVNKAGEKIARKYGRHYIKIRFTDL